MNTTIKFEFENRWEPQNGIAYIDLKQWVLNRSVGDTNTLVRKFIKPCTNKWEVIPMITIICKAFREGDIDERPYGYRTNMAINHKFWRRIEILEEAVKKLERNA